MAAKFELVQILFVEAGLRIHINGLYVAGDAHNVLYARDKLTDSLRTRDGQVRANPDSSPSPSPGSRTLVQVQVRTTSPDYVVRTTGLSSPDF